MKVIHQIEISANCNLKCIYCPNSVLVRDDDCFDMTDDIFQKSLDLCKEFEYDTEELWLHGCGESLVHPKFMEYAKATVDEMVGVKIKVSSNGLLLNEEIIKFFAENNIILHISVHKPTKSTTMGIQLAHKYGILEYVGCIPVTAASNWAGQIDWPDLAPRGECAWVERQWGCVLSDGRISTCCLDVNPKVTLGHVNDSIESLKQKEVNPIELCKTCHLTV